MIESTALRNYTMDTGSWKAAMSPCFIKFYGSPLSQSAADALIPATADAALGSATLMCTLTVDNDGVTGMSFYTAAANGVLSKDTTQTVNGTVVATGYYSFVRLVKSGDTGALSTTALRAQLTVGTIGTDVIVTSNYKTLGDDQPLTSAFFAQPSGA